MAIIRVKRAASLANTYLKSGELGVMGNDLYFGKYANLESSTTATMLANQTDNNLFTGTSTFKQSNDGLAAVVFQDTIGTSFYQSVAGRLQTASTFTFNDADLVNKLYVDNTIAAADAMILKGIVNASDGGTIFSGYVNYKTGWTFKVSVAGTLPAPLGNVQVGDMIVAMSDYDVGFDWNDWHVFQTNVEYTTIGSNLAITPNVDVISFIRINADETITTRSAANFKTDLSLNNVENTALSTWAGTSNITTIGTLSSGTVPWARLSNVPSSYTPSTHVHGNITNDGKIGSVEGIVYTNTTGVITSLNSSSATGGYVLKWDALSKAPYWSTDNDTNTTYTAGTGLTLNGTTINHTNSTTAQATSAIYPITIDAQGHVATYGTAVTSLKNPNSLIIKADSGVTEGTDLFTYDGSSAKTLNIIGGTNVSIAKTTVSWTFSSVNTYLNLASFSTTSGTLALTLNNTSTISVNLDGRYLTTTPLATSAIIGGFLTGYTTTETNRALLLSSSKAYISLPRQIPAVTINGSINYTPSFYAPTAGGTSGHVLLGSGITSTPTWSTLALGTMAYQESTSFATSTHVHGNVTNDGKIGSVEGIVYTNTTGVITSLNSSSATGGYVLKWDAISKVPYWSTDNNTNTASAVDDILDGSNVGTAIKYSPYTTAQNGKFYTLTTPAIPTNTENSLHYGGKFYASYFEGIVDGGTWS